jgi:dihydrodipicolinate synthase/N-acetylneuraminate lyase
MLTLEQLRKRWTGVVAPLVTVFKENGTPDLAGTQHNVKWLIDKGARMGNTILLAAGSGGDFSSMTVEERKQVISAIAEVADKKVPIIAGVQSTNVRDTIALCQHCEKLGIDAVQISGAYYYDGRPGDALAWLRQVAKHTDIAFAVYNNWYTGYNMPLDVIDEALNTIPQCIAVKWGTPDTWTYLAGLRRFLPKAVCCDNNFTPVLSWLHGCKVFISHHPNFYPEHPWRVLSLLQAGKYAEAQAEWDRAMEPWLQITGKVSAQTGGEGVFVRPMLELLGLKAGPSPLPSRDAAVTPEIKALYRKYWDEMQAFESKQ